MESFLEHVPTIHRAAQLTAASVEDAEALVEETFRRAIAAKMSGDPRTSLQLLLHELAQLQTDRPVPESATVAETAAAEHRGAAALEQARSAVYRTLSQLDSGDWSLMFLSEVDSLSIEDLSLYFGSSPEETAKRAQSVHAAIHRELFADAPPASRIALLDSLPEDWLRQVLSEISDDFPRVSDGLRARIAAASGPRTRPERASSHKPVQHEGPVLSEPRRRRPSFRLASILAGVLLILAVGFGADYLHSVLSSEPEKDVIALAARNAKSFRPDLETSSVARAERFLHAHSGLRPRLPVIADATLLGVGMEEIASRVHVPVIRFVDDASDEAITVYALSYRFLDMNPSVSLSADVRRQIQQEANFDLHSLGSADVLVWRSRSGIYLAVTGLSGQDLQTRIGQQEAES